MRHRAGITAAPAAAASLELEEKKKRSARLPEDHLLLPAFQELESVLTRYRLALAHTGMRLHSYCWAYVQSTCCARLKLAHLTDDKPRRSMEGRGRVARGEISPRFERFFAISALCCDLKSGGCRKLKRGNTGVPHYAHASWYEPM